MTDDDEEYPTDWHPFNYADSIECRQVSFDTYQLRSKLYVLTLDTEGFNLYRDGTPQGQVIFEDWRKRNQIEPVRRDDVDADEQS